MNGAVVVGFDETLAGGRALALAADEAALRGVRLEIVNVVRSGEGRRATDAADALSEWIVGEGERAAREAHPELSVQRSAAIIGRPDEVLTGEAEAAVMLVLGDRGHRDFAELREGTVTVPALDRATCPVMVASPDDHEPRGRITVAVDLDGPAGELLGFACEEAACRGARLRVVNVCDSHTNADRQAFDQEATGSGAASVADREQALEQALGPWRARYPDLETEAEVRTGSIGAALVELSCDGDLLVVGGRRHGDGRPGVEVGPAVHMLLQHAECPMAVVPIG